MLGSSSKVFPKKLELTVSQRFGLYNPNSFSIVEFEPHVTSGMYCLTHCYSRFSPQPTAKFPMYQSYPCKTLVMRPES